MQVNIDEGSGISLFFISFLINIGTWLKKCSTLHISIYCTTHKIYRLTLDGSYRFNRKIDLLKN